MQGYSRRKIPQRGEKRKTQAHPENLIKTGQRVKIPFGKKILNATVANHSKNGEIVVRLRQHHNRQLNRGESQELSRIVARRHSLLAKWARGNFGFNALTQVESAELESIGKRIDALASVKPVKTTNTFAVHHSDIFTKEKSENVSQRVPDSQRKNQRKQEALRQAEAALAKGANPKRLQRQLRRKGINVQIGRIQRRIK